MTRCDDSPSIVDAVLGGHARRCVVFGCRCLGLALRRAAISCRIAARRHPHLLRCGARLGAGFLGRLAGSITRIRGRRRLRALTRAAGRADEQYGQTEVGAWSTRWFSQALHHLLSGTFEWDALTVMQGNCATHILRAESIHARLLVAEKPAASGHASCNEPCTVFGRIMMASSETPVEPGTGGRIAIVTPQIDGSPRARSSKVFSASRSDVF